jgi:hypothetical protein
MDPWRELQLNETQWHDGNVHRVEVRVSEQGMEVTIEVDIYAEPHHTPDRHRLNVRLTKVREFAMVGAAAELLLNTSAGQITFARLGGMWPGARSTSRKKLPGLDLSVYLLGGYIRVLADACEVSTPRRSRQGKKDN